MPLSKASGHWTSVCGLILPSGWTVNTTVLRFAKYFPASVLEITMKKIITLYAQSKVLLKYCYSLANSGLELLIVNHKSVKQMPKTVKCHYKALGYHKLPEQLSNSNNICKITDKQNKCRFLLVGYATIMVK